MSNEKLQYPAVFYHEGKRIHIRFPDLIENGFPASSGANSKRAAIAAAKDVLTIMLDVASMDRKPMPTPSKLEKVKVDRGYDDINAEYIEILNIAI